MTFDDIPQRRNSGLLVAVATGCLFAIGLAAVAFYAKRQGPQLKGQPAVSVDTWSAAREGESWTHRDLLNHLATRGVKAEAKAAKLGSTYGPAMWFVRSPLTDEQRGKLQWLESVQGEQAYIDSIGVTWVYVQKLPTAGAARDEAGLSQNGFSWGRFHFNGDKEFLRGIRAVLP